MGVAMLPLVNDGPLNPAAPDIETAARRLYEASPVYRGFGLAAPWALLPHSIRESWRDKARAHD